MVNTNLAKGFALALFEVAQETKNIEEVYADLKIITAAFLKNKEFIEVFISPKISYEEKAKILKKVFFERINSVLYSFFDIIVKRNAFAIFPGMCEEFKIFFSMYSLTHHGELFASEKLDKKTIKLIERKIAKKLNVDFVILDFMINKDLISGFKVIISGKSFDYSIQTKIRELKEDLDLKGRLSGS